MQVKWVLEKNNTVSVQTTVMNNAIVPIPLVDGWHPYFTLGESIDNCSLQFSSKGKMEYDSDLLPTGNMITDDRFSKGLKLNENFSDLWHNYSLVKGHMPENLENLQNYNYSIVIENDLDYISEKVWKSIYAGALPIYVGPNLDYDKWLNANVFNINFHFIKKRIIKNSFLKIKAVYVLIKLVYKIIKPIYRIKKPN
jgi:galactose mutarotase-like enzyme